MVNDAILECIMNDTLGSGINVGVRLLIFEKIEGKKLKNDCNALIDVKLILILATVWGILPSYDPKNQNIFWQIYMKVLVQF